MRCEGDEHMKRIGLILTLLCLLFGDAWAETMYIDAGNADRVHLRAEPSIESQSLGLYFSGARVEAGDEMEGFTQVDIGTESGYIMSKYLKSIPEGIDSALRVGTIRSDVSYVNLRSHAEGEEVMDDVDRGDTVTVMGETANGWYCVEYGGRIGYMKRSLVRLGGLAAQQNTLLESLIFDDGDRTVTAQLHEIGGGEYERTYRIRFLEDGKEISAAGFTGDDYEYLRGYASDEGSAIMQLTDVNMDGYADVSVITYRGATDAQAAHFLYQPESGRYEYDQRLNVLSWWRCDLYPQTRQMLNYVRDGADCGAWTLYQWDGNDLEEIAVGQIRPAERDGALRASVFREGKTVYESQWDDQTDGEWQRQHDAIMTRLWNGTDSGGKVPLAQSRKERVK